LGKREERGERRKERGEIFIKGRIISFINK
jgi:hypothetical protein